MIAARLTRRPELLVVLALIVVVALLPDGLPLGIAGLGVVTGCVAGLHAMGIALLYSRTGVLSFAQFGLGAAASVLFYFCVLYNQWAVLANGICHCLAPDGASMSTLQHNPNGYTDYLAAHHPWVIVANALFTALLGVALAFDTGRVVFNGIATSFARAPRIVPTVATLAFAVALGGVGGLATLRNAHPLGWYGFHWFPWGARPGTGEKGVPAVPEGVFHAPHHESWGFGLGGGARFHLYDILAVVIALLALAFLTWRFELGPRGLASRATAANVERASTLGVDIIRESRQPWRIAGALSGFAGVLSVSLAESAPNVGLDMASLTLVLAAVVLARMTSPVLALLASIALGVLAQGMFWNFNSQVQFQGSLVLIIGVALLLQRGRASRAQRDAESVFTSAP
jgi:branched-subunit amino acid ABC-type transport system permease component